jgi:hypothetical protein
MLAMGVHPGVVSATSSAMILFTSFASTTSFFVFGLILPDFALVGFCIGFVASFIGNNLMRQARQARSATGRNFERNSYIAFAIGGVVLISALLMTIQVSTRIFAWLRVIQKVFAIYFVATVSSLIIVVGRFLTTPYLFVSTVCLYNY